MSPLSLLRRGRSASTAVANAWQAMADDRAARTNRDRLAPGLRSAADTSWLDAIDIAGCWSLLESATLGRIGFTAHSGQPLILPVNYAVVGRRVLIRSGRGPKLEAARRGDLVAFHADQIDLELHVGWSVTLTGRARWIRDASERAMLAPSAAPTWAGGPRDELIVIDPVHVGGRRLSVPELDA